MKVGPQGGAVGSLSVDGVTIEVPPGALAQELTITVEAAGSAPAGYQALSPVYRFKPDGAQFQKPVTITLAMARAEARAAVYFTRAGSEEYENIGGNVSGQNITAQVSHFSGGFVGGPSDSADGGLDASATTPSDGGTNGPVDAAVVQMEAGTSSPGCPPAGVYALTSFHCGAMDITATWKSIIPTSTLTFASQGSECTMVLSNSSASCSETQESRFVFGASGSQARGITSCSPASCTFNTNDAPCVVGDRAMPAASEPAAPFSVVDGRITIRTPANTGDLCGVVEGIQVFDINPGRTTDAGIPASKFRDNSDGTVTDSAASLTWQQTLATALYAWDAADAYCKALALAPGGWRLPTLEELRSIVDTSRSPARIDPTFFPSTPAEKFWTSSPNGSSQHWYVDFQSGSYNAGSGQELRVRCVR